MAMIEKIIVKNPQATFRVTCSTLFAVDLGRAFEVDTKGTCSASVEEPKGDMVLIFF